MNGLQAPTPTPLLRKVTIKDPTSRYASLFNHHPCRDLSGSALHARRPISRRVGVFRLTADSGGRQALPKAAHCRVPKSRKCIMEIVQCAAQGALSFAHRAPLSAARHRRNARSPVRRLSCTPLTHWHGETPPNRVSDNVLANWVHPLKDPSPLGASPRTVSRILSLPVTPKGVPLLPSSLP
jgi:hypothetical protein